MWGAAFASIQPGVTSISSKQYSLPVHNDGVCRFWMVSLKLVSFVGHLLKIDPPPVIQVSHIPGNSMSAPRVLSL